MPDLLRRVTRGALASAYEESVVRSLSPLALIPPPFKELPRDCGLLKGNENLIQERGFRLSIPREEVENA